jgi:hypothetical protein
MPSQDLTGGKSDAYVMSMTSGSKFTLESIACIRFLIFSGRSCIYLPTSASGNPSAFCAGLTSGFQASSVWSSV